MLVRMKFIIFLIELFSISLTFSSTINRNFVRRDEDTKIIEKRVNVNVNRNTLDVSMECRNDLNRSSEYKECSDIKFINSNYDYLCSVLNSRKCQDFFKNPISYLPNCKNDKTIVDVLSTPMMKVNMASISLMCTKDDNGNLCPAAEASLNNKVIDTNAINLTCKSKKCIESLSYMVEATLDNIDDIGSLSISNSNNLANTKKVFLALLSNLNSEKCITQIVDNAKSGALSLNINYAKLFTIGILYILLL